MGWRGSISKSTQAMKIQHCGQGHGSLPGTPPPTPTPGCKMFMCMVDEMMPKIKIALRELTGMGETTMWLNNNNDMWITFSFKKKIAIMIIIDIYCTFIVCPALSIFRALSQLILKTTQ